MKDIYKDICERTGGNVYIGVVGPVRSGKSTFVTNFIEKLILPSIQDANDRARTVDELPQSADGKTIMTTQPKFVPNTAVKITLEDKTTANVRLIDCVGYLVEGAEGHLEGDKSRLVNTPWSSEPIPFEKAAEIGTQKVATEHSTVAVVVTTDGTIGQIERKNYVIAEERAVKELKNAGKPFVVVLNSRNPDAQNTLELCATLQQKYGVTVLPLDVQNADTTSLQSVLGAILQEFPLRRIGINLPKWMRALNANNKYIAQIMHTVKEGAQNVEKMKDAPSVAQSMLACPIVEGATVASLDMGNGVATLDVSPLPNLFFDVLSEEANTEICDEFSLMSYVSSSAYAKSRFDGIKDALQQADECGYGVVYPALDKMTMDEPSMIKQGNVYAVKLKASAPSYHIIKVDVGTEVSPMVGTEQQSQYLLDQYKQDPQAIWQTNVFGKTMAGLAKEGLEGKCSAVPTEIKQKLTKTVNKIVNENRGGLICLLL